MKKISVLLFLLSLFVMASLNGCTKDKTPMPVATSSTPCDPNKVYFQKDIMPILNSNCAKSGCHDAATSTDGVNLSTYEGARQQVSPGRPGDSKIIEMINEDDEDKRMPPPPNTPLSADQKNLLIKWIQQGADNAVCGQDAGGCNPVNVSFANDIQPVINTNCIGCHGTGNSTGVTLSTHAGVQEASQNNRLYNAVAQNGLETPMPPNTKLSACDIQKIKVWVDAGAPNN
jgi:hypothetical protein